LGEKIVLQMAHLYHHFAHDTLKDSNGLLNFFSSFKSAYQLEMTSGNPKDFIQKQNKIVTQYLLSSRNPAGRIQSGAAN
jgi:hypothetical protein